MLGALLLGGCAVGELWWSHPTATRDQFVASLRKCRTLAKRSLPVREGTLCRANTAVGGYCSEESTLEQAVREERERLMQEEVKDSCLEARGFTNSEKGEGFREVRKTPDLPQDNEI